MEKNYVQNKVALVFPGQGAQRIGMLQEFYEESSIVRDTFQEASDILHYDLFHMTQCRENNINLLEISTPLIFTGSVAAFRHFRENFSVLPFILAGHSLGEYSALTCAGAFTFQEGLELVMYRAKIAQRIKEESGASMMVISRINANRVEDMCRQMRSKGKQVWISCYNAIQQICICGKRTDLNQIASIVEQWNGHSYYLEYNAPYHTPFMNGGKKELSTYLEKILCRTLQFPVLSSMNGKAFNGRDLGKMLEDQLVEPVQWNNTMRQLALMGCDSYIECGSGSILQRLLKRTLNGRNIVGYENIRSSNDVKS